MKQIDKKIESKCDKLPLAMTIMSPESEPVKGIVQISHGMAEHKERYYTFMEFLTENGYITVIHDHRGHGDSVKEDNDLGYFYDKITIDKGSASGIEEKMAVVTNEGLIGTVTHVGYTTSDIKLLTNSDVNQKISVKIKGDTDYSYGLLSGYDSNKKTFTITGIAGNKEIKEGAEVTTTGLGDIFPSGILIGYVKTITKDHFDLERIIEIESKVDFDAVRYVTVLKRKES